MAAHEPQLSCATKADQVLILLDSLLQSILKQNWTHTHNTHAPIQGFRQIARAAQRLFVIQDRGGEWSRLCRKHRLVRACVAH